MRLSVRRFRVCPGEEKRTLRKSALCSRRVTEKRILQPAPHGKAHSAAARVATVYTNAPKRRQVAIFGNLCTLLRFRVCPGEKKRTLRKSAVCSRRVTEKRILQPLAAQ